MPRPMNLNNMPPIGKKIGGRLKEMGKQQKQFAQEAGLSQAYVWAVMNGRQIPTLASLKQMAKPLKMDPFDLVGALFGKE